VTRYLRIFSLFCLFWLSPLAAQTANILDAYNGDFESGLAQWRFFEVPSSLGSTATVVTSDVARGTKAIKLVFVAPDASLGDRALDNWDTNVPVAEGQSYTVSVQAKTTVPGTLKLRITFGFFDESRAVLTEGDKEYLLTSSYQTFSTSATAPATAVYCWIAFRLSDGSGPKAAGTLFLDDAQLIGAGVEPPPPLVPRVVPVTLPSDDVPIVSLVVTESPYNAKQDGTVDATTPFQQAIDNAASRGGGVVFIPAGKYRFDGSLTLKEKVTLRGDWQSPHDGGTGKGTILEIYGGRGSETGTPFLTMHRGTGVKNLTIWYPAQTISVVPYPWTIFCFPSFTSGGSDNTSVMNVTLVNPYQAIKIGPASNELHYIRNVYGTPLKTGIWLSETTDIGRIINVHFEPKYWSGSTLSNSPSEASIKAWTQANGEGIAMGRSDWEYMYDISLIGYKTGVRIFRYDPSGPAANGVIYGLRTEEGEVGIKFEMGNPYGFAITNSTINASAGASPVCVLATNTFSTVAQFNTCSFGGSPKTAVLFEDNSTARMTFQNCTFADWGYQGGDAAVRLQNGSVAILGSEFKKDKPHVYLGSSVQNAQILDNVVPSKLNIMNLSAGEVAVSQEPLGMPKLSAPPHQFAAERKPATNALFVVSAYGAVGDKSTDDTPAFQAALDAAGQAGGGTVYVPAGWYKIASHLNVPPRVELRGIWDVPHHTISQGSVLLASEGNGNAGGTPFITLQQNSGVRGLTVWYPDQNYVAFPWTIRVGGANCWVKDVVLANSYQGIDLATVPSPNHWVSYVGGSPLKTGLYVSNNTGEGWIENVQFNSHYWNRSTGYPKNVSPNPSSPTTYQQANLDALKFGSCFFEHQAGNFVFAAKRGLYFTNDGGPCKSDVFMHGTDAGSYAVSVESPAGSQLNFINSQLVLTAATSVAYIHTGSDFAGTAGFFNTLEWGNQSGATASINGTGTVSLQQVNTSVSGITLSGGVSSVHNVTMSQSLTPQFTIGPGIVSSTIFGNYAPGGFQMSNAAGDKVEADYNYARMKGAYGFATGWESADPQNQWNDILYSSVNIAPFSGSVRPRSAAVGFDGGKSLFISGRDSSASTSSIYFKLFKIKVRVFESTVLSYSLNPQTELGRRIHVDLLFADGSRLTELKATASDSLPLSVPRGALQRWTKIVCPVGSFAAGKQIQEILVGYSNPSSEGDFSAYLDSLELRLTGGIPVPWSRSDVGGSSKGSAVLENGLWYVLGAGRGLLYGGDNFNFLSQPFSGNVCITARLETQEQVMGGSFAGVMIRESQDVSSRLVMLGLYPQFGLQSSFRVSPTAPIQSVTHDVYGKNAPRWLRIVRSGNLFTTYTSPDGIVWQDTLYRLTVQMDPTVAVGLAASSGSTSETMDSPFSSVIVSVNPPTSVGGVTAQVPQEFQLYQNYPNPFNPSTMIRYALPRRSNVDIEVFNMMGQKIALLVHDRQAAGEYQVLWNGVNNAGMQVASGVYLCRMRVWGDSDGQSDGQFFTKKLLLVR